MATRSEGVKRPSATRLVVTVSGHHPKRVTRNPFDESHWASRLRENLLSSSYGARQLFFKWIKQQLRIKAFFETSENAVKTQIDTTKFRTKR
jgi:hypothetical protein